MLEINSHTHHTKKLPVIKKSFSKTAKFIPVENKQDLSYLTNDETFFFPERTEEEVKELLLRFETKFNMTSEEFKKLHAIGKIPDACEIMVWEALLGLE